MQSIVNSANDSEGRLPYSTSVNKDKLIISDYASIRRHCPFTSGCLPQEMVILGIVNDASVLQLLAIANTRVQNIYLPACHYRHVCRPITVISPESVIQIPGQICLSCPCLPHGVCVCPSRCLSSFAHVGDLSIALDISQLVGDVP